MAGAAKWYEQAATMNESESAARARLMLGEISFLKKDYKEALKQFFKVGYGFGYPQAPEAIKPWQAIAIFEAGGCFENLKNVEQARKSYQEVVDKFPNSDKVADARRRLQSLEALGK